MEQRELLDKLIESLKANNQNVRLKIESKRDEIKVKLKERGVDEEKIKEKIIIYELFFTLLSKVSL